MIIKNTVFIVGSSGQYLDSQKGRIKALDNLSDVIYVIAPFEQNTVVMASYVVYDAPKTPISQQLKLTDLTGADLLSETDPLYQTVATWNVWGSPITAQALAKISKYSAGRVGVAFSFKELLQPEEATTYEGTFGYLADIPETATAVGDYRVCDMYNYVSAELGETIAKGTFVYWNGTAWVIADRAVKVANASTVTLLVDPSILANLQSTATETDELEALIAQLQADVNLSVVGHEVRISDLEDFKDDVVAGDVVIERIRLGVEPNYVDITYTHTNGNHYQVVDIKYPDGRVAQVNEEIYVNYRNTTGVTVNSGRVLGTAGVTTGNQAVNAELYDPDGANKYKLLGIATVDGIGANAKSKATRIGIITRISTSTLFASGTTYAEGQYLYAVADGKMSNVMPTKPSHVVMMGIVINVVGSNVDVLTCPFLFQELAELSDVNLTSVASGHILRYNGTIWVNVADLTTLETSVSNVIAGTTPIAYDNATSGLDAETIKEAIDELADEKENKTGVDTKISTHNTSETAHLFIRTLIENLEQEIQRLDGRGKSFGEIPYTTEFLKAQDEQGLSEVFRDFFETNFPAIGTNWQNGYLVYDLGTGDGVAYHEWEFNGTVWVDNGLIGYTQASNTIFGMVKGNNYVSIVSGLMQILKSDYAERLGTSEGYYDYTSLVSAISNLIDKDFSAYADVVIDDTDLMLFNEGGVAKKGTVGDLKSHIVATTGTFDPTADYQPQGLGAYESVVLDVHDVTLHADGDFRCTIKAIETDKLLYVQFPTVTATEDLRLSTDNGSTYYNVLKNGSTVEASVMSGQLVEMYFNGTNFIAYAKDGLYIVEQDVLDLETANMIKSITRSGSDLFTITYYDDTTSSLLTLAEIKTFIGEATQSLSGLMSAQDKTDLDTLMALFDADGDSVVNTIAEILAIFEDYPEGADLVTVLQGKVDKTSIVDNLTTNDATKVLSAKQGKVLNDAVALKVNTSDIVNNLTSTDTNKPLSANQGKALKDLIDATVGDIDTILDSILGV